MANILIYGPDKPKISFVQMPDGQISFRSQSDRVIDLDRIGPNAPIRWADVSTNSYLAYLISERDYSIQNQFQDIIREFEFEKEYEMLIDRLANLVGSATEEKFLRAYAKSCLSSTQDRDILAAWACPALIPQVWVNWIHYDSKDQNRAKRAQREPFRVDFVIRHPSLSPNLVIIEIDGLSHFGNVRMNDGGGLSFDASMDAYTEHLRKDRWLRQKGWTVIRLSNQEVENYEKENEPYWDFERNEWANSFPRFWNDITGKYWFEKSPIPF